MLLCGHQKQTLNRGKGELDVYDPGSAFTCVVELVLIGKGFLICHWLYLEENS